MPWTYNEQFETWVNYDGETPQYSSVNPDTGQTQPTAASPTEKASTTTDAGYTLFADGAVRQAKGSQAFELLTSDGWKTIGTPEHSESLYYVTTALSSPTVAQFLKFAAAHPDQLNREQQLFMQNPLTSLDSYGQGYRWGENNLYDDKLTAQFAGQTIQTGDATKLTEGEKTAGAAFNVEQSPEEQSKRAGDDDMNFLAIALTVVAMVFAPYAIPLIAETLAISEVAAAAIYGGAKSLITGGDMGDVLTGAVMGGVGAEFFGGGTGIDSGSVADAAGNLYNPDASSLGGGGGGGFDPSTMTYANAGQVTDSPQYPATATDPGYVGDLPPADYQMPGGQAQPGSSPQPGGLVNAAMSTPTQEDINALGDVGGTSRQRASAIEEWAGINNAEPKGLVDSVIDWAKSNQTLATAAVGAAGTMAAGLGSAVINKSALEEKIQADKDIVNQKFTNDTTGKQQFVQGNSSVFGWKRPIKPTNKPLTRLSTGQPVYSGGGIINSRMGGG